MSGYATELHFAKRFAKAAGLIMTRHFQGLSVQTKPDGSVVTIADKAINNLLISWSTELFPAYAVLSEEKSIQRPNAPYTWVCDPIDGSLPFSLGIPTCVFALALVDAYGTPLVAVVYDPFLKNMYWAIKGTGAFRGHDPLHIGDNTMSHCVGFSGRSSKILNVPVFKSAVDSTYQRVATKSFIYEAMLVVAGRLDGAILMGDGVHDAAAAQLIVTEAGGRATSLFGTEQRYDKPIQGLIVAAPLAHNELVQFAKACVKLV